jgi:AcrR family transcriptional regulator
MSRREIMSQTKSAMVFGHPTKPLVYSSTAITARRKRILKEARKLLSEKGFDGFTVRELCARAGVAQRTLYNAFHNKDRIVALAIREAYEEFQRRTSYSTFPDTLDGVLQRSIAVNRRNFAAREYTKAVTALYFSPNTGSDIVRSLQDMAFNLHGWLDRVEKNKQFAPWIRRDELELIFKNAEYATINDWVRGLISDEDYLRRLVETILIITIGASRGATQAQATRILKKIRATGRLPEYPKSTEEESASARVAG